VKLGLSKTFFKGQQKYCSEDWEFLMSHNLDLKWLGGTSTKIKLHFNIKVADLGIKEKIWLMKLKGNIELGGCQWNSHWKEKLREKFYGNKFPWQIEKSRNNWKLIEQW